MMVRSMLLFMLVFQLLSYWCESTKAADGKPLEDTSEITYKKEYDEVLGFKIDNQSLAPKSKPWM